MWKGGELGFPVASKSAVGRGRKRRRKALRLLVFEAVFNCRQLTAARTPASLGLRLDPTRLGLLQQVSSWS
jgi:hypothetical protein